MGDNLRRNFPFQALPSDPQACVSELTRTNSDTSDSAVTIESFRDHTANARPGQTIGWTNEKHNSYLEFLEASFIKQLQCSMSSRGRYPQEEMWEPCPAPQLPAKGHNSSYQFLVLQDGCCQKINCEGNDCLLDSTADSSDNLGSPRLHQSKNASKSSTAPFPVRRETVVFNDGIYLRNNTNLGDSTTEVSDQNFVDEDRREKTSAKRLKMMAVLDASSNSQERLRHLEN